MKAADPGCLGVLQTGLATPEHLAFVEHVLDTGKTIEAYPNDQPYPSRLVLGWLESRPIHVVIADDQASQETIIITVYEPDPERWEADFETRKPR